METIKLSGNLRTTTGKGKARQLRQKGLIPGIVYGNKENLLISFDSKEMSLLLKKTGTHNVLSLNLDNKKEKMVIFKEVQKDVLSRDILHVDLMEISKKKKLKINALVEEVGTAIGTKMGGILTRLLREVRIECLPANIPQSIKIDVSNLEVGQTLHVGDLEVPEGVAVLNSPEDTLFAVNLPEAEKAKEAEEPSAEAAAEEGKADEKAEAKTEASADAAKQKTPDKG